MWSRGSLLCLGERDEATAAEPKKLNNRLLVLTGTALIGAGLILATLRRARKETHK